MASSCITMFLAAWPSSWQRNARSFEGQRRAGGSSPALPGPALPYSSAPSCRAPPLTSALREPFSTCLVRAITSVPQLVTFSVSSPFTECPKRAWASAAPPAAILPRPAPRPRYGERRGPEGTGTRCAPLCAALCCPLLSCSAAQYRPVLPSNARCRPELPSHPDSAQYYPVLTAIAQ